MFRLAMSHLQATEFIDSTKQLLFGRINKFNGLTITQSDTQHEAT
jgi:hypothetical protein